MKKKLSYYRFFKRKFLKFCQKHELLRLIVSISQEKYAERLSGSIMYGLLSAIAVNLFYRPGEVYSSGATGLAQIISEISRRFFNLAVPISLVFYLINIPLLAIAWRKIGHKFTIFTFITVTFSAIFIQFVPPMTIVNDPLLNAIFGGIVLGTGIGYALKTNVSSGGSDIVSLLIRKKTGRDVGFISMVVNLIILVMAGTLFGWKYALYSMVSVFISGRMTDAIFVKQKKMQAMIVTSHADRVISKIHKKLKRGVTIINEAEGAYRHEKKTILMTIITRAEFHQFKQLMRKADPAAFVSVADNVHIIGLFVDDE